MIQLSMTIDGACEATGLGRTKIYEAIKEGDLAAKKNGKRTIILQTDLQNFLENLPDYPAVGGFHG